GVEVEAVEVFAQTGVETGLALGVEVEAGAEVLEDLAVVLAAGDDRAEHRREGVSRDAEPVSPGAVFTGFVDENLSDVEPDGADRRHGQVCPFLWGVSSGPRAARRARGRGLWCSTVRSRRGN